MQFTSRVLGDQTVFCGLLMRGESAEIKAINCFAEEKHMLASAAVRWPIERGLMS